METDKETKEQIQAFQSLVREAVEDWSKMLTEQAKTNISIFDKSALTNAITLVIAKCLKD